MTPSAAAAFVVVATLQWQLLLDGMARLVVFTSIVTTAMAAPLAQMLTLQPGSESFADHGSGRLVPLTRAKGIHARMARPMWIPVLLAIFILSILHGAMQATARE